MLSVPFDLRSISRAGQYLARTDVALYCPGSKGLVVLCPANYKGNEATPGFLCSAKPDAPLLGDHL